MRKLLTLLVMAVALTTFADTSTTYAIGNLSFNTSGETREASVDTYTIIGAKLTSSINPAIYGEGTSAELRVYANGTVTVSTTSTAFTRLVFNLSAQGKKRLPPITASVGTVATQSSGDETVTWTGSATSVTFTVGAKADYGSEGSSKAGQFCIQSFTVTTPSSSATVDTPTFSPVGGTYTSAQSVTINCTTSDATIHYTTDGTTPTSSSATYSSAINVSETTTIKAIAVKSGMTNSEVATATYTINLPQVETPTFSPAAGTYTSAQSVTINCATSGATIYYTTDGSTPTTSSATYSGAISVSSTTTIKAIAVKNDMTDSEVASATYTIEAGSSGGGDGLTYEKVTSISSSDVGKKFIIVYEATPAAMGAISSTSTTYGQSITGTSNFTLSDSQITLTSNSSVAPLTLGGTSGAWTFLFEDGKYMSWSSGNSLASATSVSTNSQWAVTFSDGVPTIANGYDNTRKLQYNSASNSLRFACYTSSQQSVALYRQVSGSTTEQVATPVISPSDGTVITGPTSVSISCTTDGATIHYTTDGTTPTSSSTTYSTAFTVSATTTVKAIAVKSGMTDSEVASATITYQAPVTSDEYTLVTDASTLASGDIVIIVVNNATPGASVMTAETVSSVLKTSTTDVTLSQDYSTVTLGSNAEALELVLEGSTGAWKFRNGSNYLYANPSNNSLTMASDNSAKVHSIDISDDNATIRENGTSDRVMRYNYNSGTNPRIGTYASTYGSPVQIYRKTAAASSVTTVTGIAAFKEVTAGETVRLYLPDSYNARVLHASQTAANASAGTYTYDAYVRDSSGAMLIKGLVTTREMTHDQHIAGWLMGQYSTASDGNPQLTPDLCQSTDRTHCPWFVIADPVSETATEPVAVAATEVAGHAADWVKVSNVKVGTTSLTLTNAFNASYNVYNGALVDVSAIATPTAVYPVALGDEPVITHVVDATQAFVSPSSSISDVEVRLAKPFTAGVWTPLTVPFDITEFDGVIMEYIGVQQGDPVTAPSGRQFDAGNMIFEQATSIQAGVPYLVKAHDTTSGMTFSGVTLSNEPAGSVTHTVNVSSTTYNAPRRVSSTDEYTMTGTYSPTSVSTDDNSVKVMTDDGSVGWASALGGSVDGSSAYFTTPADQALRIVFDGDSSGTITGINDILAEGDAVAVEGTYNLMGVRMTGDWQSLPAGIYIVNGKKTVKQ
ncbi:MAG: chitobiase/beta-hexosaminidase C-terminal domain-containing protein [Muribaculaceae bacterium]|nr:chitobiase/beta-hexosaminidase C-terminal domain-containing protein [Muribaculaceae bacterium]